MKTPQILTSVFVAACLTGATVALASPVLPSVAAGFPIPELGGAVAGEVVQAKSGGPVANAPVRLLSGGNLVAVSVTSGSGQFDFGNVAPGAYTVESGSASRAVNISGHAVYVTLLTR